jgi:hypothetical protein
VKTYLTARREAGSPRGIEYAKRLVAMSPADAADEIADMFALVVAEDLAEEIYWDLQLDLAAAKRIAQEIAKRRDY